MSVYNLTDYRRFFLAHSQFLTGLCEISIQSINVSINQFLSSLWVSAQLLPESIFHAHIDLLIKQNQLDASRTFVRLLSLVRITNDGNAIISGYGTNFKYIPNSYGTDSGLSRIQAIIYDDHCSCGVNATCTTQAYFINANSSENIPIKGLKVGCTPSESFLASTLECFYDSECIDVLYEHLIFENNISSRNVPVSLSISMNQFPVNTTIIDLISTLFVQNWSRQINYSSYFQQCSPSMCSYTYIQEINSLYTLTLLLGFFGGLSIVLKWICPIIVRIVAKILQYRKKKKNIVVPVNTIETTTNEPITALADSTNVSNCRVDLQATTTVLTPQYDHFFKFNL